jgi:hypothetical protein
LENAPEGAFSLAGVTHNKPETEKMNRREFLATTVAGALGALSAPALAQGSSRVLRFVPEGNLNSPDPVWTTTTIAANHAMMIYDQLYARDANFMPQPQMVAGHELSDDRLTWTFTLRDGLLFHDGEKVRAADCVASVQRWARRNPLGQKLLEVSNEMTALDDKRFQVRLKKPFALILNAFATGPFMMPERVAKTDPFQQISEYVGCGPFKFLRDEWVTGVQAVYERFDRYVPRQEPSDFMAGGKRAHFERVEWTIMPDSATAAAALRNNEIDWWEFALPDLAPTLSRTSGVTVAQVDDLGFISILRFNAAQPPFNNTKLRHAVLAAVDQADYMRAVNGDNVRWQRCASFFPCGVPFVSEVGAPIMSTPRDLAKAREAVKAAGYAGELFLDEIDKIAGGDGGGVRGPDVSRGGVQRDLLPIVEGSNVNTKYGVVKTDHMLFVAAGAFHVAKVSDLIPELQGRFPIRVELEPLTREDLVRILKEPRNSLVRQYTALLATEGVDVQIRDDAVDEIARIAAEVNERMENIGARRLHTVMERLLDQLSFEGSELRGQRIVVDAAYVRERLEGIAQDEDLSRYIL